MWVETIKTTDKGYVRLYGRRPKSVSAGLGSGLRWTSAQHQWSWICGLRHFIGVPYFTFNFYVQSIFSKMVILSGNDDIGHRRYRSQPYRPQTILYRPQAKSISATCRYRPRHIVHRAHNVVFSARQIWARDILLTNECVAKLHSCM